MANLVVHFEIHATEPQRLIDFYSELLGWEFDRFPGEIPYWSIRTGEGAVGGPTQPGFGINGGLTPRVGPAPEPGSPINGADLVVGVEGIDALFAKAVELGAVVATPLDDLPGVGRIGNLFDPDGNFFGLIDPVLSDGSNVMDAA